MLPHILVLHGFGKKAPNDIALALFSLPDAKIIAPQLNYFDFLETKNTLDSMVLNQFDDPNINEFVVVGCSFGGFWAHYLTKKYNIKTVLINPALNAIDYFAEKKIIANNKTVKQYLSLSKEYNLTNYKEGTSVDVVVGIKDGIINPYHALMNFPCCVILNEGHKIKDYKTVISIIQKNISSK